MGEGAEAAFIGIAAGGVDHDELGAGTLFADGFQHRFNADTVAPHIAVYIQDGASGDLHELVFIPERQQIEVDIVSTHGEHSAESSARLQKLLASAFPAYRVKIDGPSWWRGERRVAEACRAQVSLRDVLLGNDLAAVKAKVDRLQTVGTLMEKQSRVTSWGVRTISGPLLAATGVITYLALGRLTVSLGETQVNTLQTASSDLSQQFSVFGTNPQEQLSTVSQLYGFQGLSLDEVLAKYVKVDPLHPGTKIRKSLSRAPS